jgi:hypothetical protein
LVLIGYDSGIADDHDVDRCPAKSVAGHFCRAAHGLIHFPLWLQLPQIIVRDLVPGFFVSNNNEFPGLAVAAGRRPAGTIEDPANEFLWNLPALVVTADTSALLDQRAKIGNIHLMLHWLSKNPYAHACCRLWLRRK